MLGIFGLIFNLNNADFCFFNYKYNKDNHYETERNT